MPCNQILKHFCSGSDRNVHIVTKTIYRCTKASALYKPMNEETNLICFLSKWPWTCYPISVYHMYTTIQHMYTLPNLLLLLWLHVIRVAHIYHIIDTEPNMRLNSSIEATKPLKPEHTTTRKSKTRLCIWEYILKIRYVTVDSTNLRYLV